MDGTIDGYTPYYTMIKHEHSSLAAGRNDGQGKGRPQGQENDKVWSNDKVRGHGSTCIGAE